MRLISVAKLALFVQQTTCGRPGVVTGQASNLETEACVRVFDEQPTTSRVQSLRFRYSGAFAVAKEEPTISPDQLQECSDASTEISVGGPDSLAPQSEPEDLRLSQKSVGQDVPDSVGVPWRVRKYLSKKFTCGICEKTCANQAGLVNHMTRVHAEKTFIVGTTDPHTKGYNDPESNYQCMLCGLSYVYSSGLWRHTKAEHSLATQVLNNGQVWRGSFLAHKNRDAECLNLITKNDTNTQQYMCKLCGIVYIYSSSLWRHMKRVHLVPTEACLWEFACNECPRSYKKRPSLLKHIRRKHPQTTKTLVKRFPCEVCDKRYSHQYTLHTHMATIHRYTRSVQAPTNGSMDTE